MVLSGRWVNCTGHEVKYAHEFCVISLFKHPSLTEPCSGWQNIKFLPCRYLNYKPSSSFTLHPQRERSFRMSVCLSGKTDVSWFRSMSIQWHRLIAPWFKTLMCTWYLNPVPCNLSIYLNIGNISVYIFVPSPSAIPDQLVRLTHACPGRSLYSVSVKGWSFSPISALSHKEAFLFVLPTSTSKQE